MSWFSILPESLSFLETWAIRFFLLLGTLMIGPWILLLIYDILLFLIRTILYDLPILGGRARNRPRPRAPSLRNRPTGRPRAMSLSIPVIVGSAPGSPLGIGVAFGHASGNDVEGEKRNGTVQRSGKTELGREAEAKLGRFYEESGGEDLEGIAKETDLPIDQVREWLTLAHQRQRKEDSRTAPF